MRWAGLAVILSFALCGCEAAVGPLLAVSAGSIVLVKRSPVDVVASAVTGLDCSIVRLADGRSYCKPPEPPPAAPRYCTRSLGRVDCWAMADPFGYPQREVADGPALTSEQEGNRTARWPFR